MRQRADRRRKTQGTSGTSPDVPNRPKTWFRRPCDGWCHSYVVTHRSAVTGAAAPERMDPKLSGLVEAWDTGDGVVRRELLSTLFSDIHVSQGRVKGYTPRPDREAQVTRLMDTVRWKLSVTVGG